MAFFLSAIALTSILFYIDEGAYTFQWIFHWGNWFVFIVYVFGLVVGQFAVNEISLWFFKKTNLGLDITLGNILGLVGIFSLFNLIH